jgi:hypothetical protein
MPADTVFCTCRSSWIDGGYPYNVKYNHSYLTKMQEKENFFRILMRRLNILKRFTVTGLRVVSSEPYLHNRIICGTLISACIINGIMWSYLIINRTNDAYPIILHYNLFFGVDLVGEYDKVFIMPGIALAFLVLNTFLGNFFYKIERIASYLLTFNVLILQFLFMLASYLIIKVNA